MITITKKQELLGYIDSHTDTKRKNIMGCSENWYDPFYAVSHTFSKQEIARMSDETIEACLKVAYVVGEGLY